MTRTCAVKQSTPRSSTIHRRRTSLPMPVDKSRFIGEESGNYTRGPIKFCYAHCAPLERED